MHIREAEPIYLETLYAQALMLGKPSPVCSAIGYDDAANHLHACGILTGTHPEEQGDSVHECREEGCDKKWI